MSLTATVAPTPDGGTVIFTDGGAPISDCSGAPVAVATGGQAVCHTHVRARRNAQPRRLLLQRRFLRRLGLGCAGRVRHERGRPTRWRCAFPEVISRASISPRRFPATRATTLRLTLSEAARITVAVTELRQGHAVDHRCSTNVLRGESCVARLTLVRFHFDLRAGRKALKLSFRKLASRGYTAFISATNHAGRRSRRIRIKFTIVRVQR